MRDPDRMALALHILANSENWGFVSPENDQSASYESFNVTDPDAYEFIGMRPREIAEWGLEE